MTDDVYTTVTTYVLSSSSASLLFSSDSIHLASPGIGGRHKLDYKYNINCRHSLNRLLEVIMREDAQIKLAMITFT